MEFFEAGEAAFEEDVVAVAGEHEFLTDDFDLSDVGAGGQEFDALALQEVFGFCGERTEAVDPVFLELVEVVQVGGVGKVFVGRDTGAGGFHVGRGKVGADDAFAAFLDGHFGFAPADEVGFEGGVGAEGGCFALEAFDGLPEELAV